MKAARIVSVALAAGVLGLSVAQATASPRARSASDPTISLRSTEYGKILVNSKGYTVYLWAKDKRDKSVCNSSCLAVWPFVLVKGHADCRCRGEAEPARHDQGQGRP